MDGVKVFSKRKGRVYIQSKSDRLLLLIRCAAFGRGPRTQNVPNPVNVCVYL